MSIVSCIQHPVNTYYAQLHAWQVDYCQGNHCAALLLSYFIAWHDWAVSNKQDYSRFNDFIKACSDNLPYDERAYLSFTINDLINGCLGLYDQREIIEGLELLANLGVISVHCLNSGRHMDDVKCFQFYPEICNQWLADHYDTKAIVDNVLNTKRVITVGEDSSGVLGSKYNSLSSKIADIMDLLVDKGFPTDKLKFPEEFDSINQLLNRGAQLSHFAAAYDLAIKSTAHCNLNIHILLNIVVDVMRN